MKAGILKDVGVGVGVGVWVYMEGGGGRCGSPDNHHIDRIIGSDSVDVLGSIGLGQARAFTHTRSHLNSRVR